MNFNKLFLVFFLSLTFHGCAFIASRVVPVNDIKSPSGKYEIGTQIFHWTDNTRDEWFSSKEGDKRELMVQVWYPALKPNELIDPYPWIDNANLREEAIMENFKVPKFVAKAIDRVDTGTYLNSIPILSEKFPIAIFSHGFEGFRSQNTTQIQELASNGYIVFALDHTYDATLTIMSDGRLIPNAKKYCYGCEADQFYEVFIPQINTRIDDVRFILNQIEKINNGNIETNFANALDIENIGVFGHSFGGGTSLASSILDSRIKSCISLDGWYVPVHPDIYNKGLTIPFMHLGQVEWDTPVNYQILDEILDTKVIQGYKLSLEGANHMDFTDSPHISKLSSSFQLSSGLESEEILNVTNTAVIGFFDEHLKSKNTNWLLELRNNINTRVEEFKNEK